MLIVGELYNWLLFRALRGKAGVPKTDQVVFSLPLVVNGFQFHNIFHRLAVSRHRPQPHASRAFTVCALFG
jgi:hypothetical protein